MTKIYTLPQNMVYHEKRTGLVSPESSLKGRKAAVVGVGIAGLTQALLLQEAGCEKVTIYSPLAIGETTSNLAGASVKPSNADFPDKTRTALALRRNQQAYTALFEQGVQGIELDHTHIEADRNIDIDAKQWYLDAMNGVTPLADSQSIPGGYASAVSYKTIFIDSPVLLRSLFNLFLERGGNFVKLDKPFETLSDLAHIEEADLVFNCTGLGARELAKDEAVYPGRGQFVVIGPRDDMGFSINAVPEGPMPDGINASYQYRRIRIGLIGDDGLPLEGETVLGGSFEDSNDPKVRPEQSAAIKSNAERVLGKIDDSEVKREGVGFRPCRRGGVRVELETIDGMPIVHNYGHGGSGFTLAFGASREALDLAEQAFN